MVVVGRIGGYLESAAEGFAPATDQNSDNVNKEVFPEKMDSFHRLAWVVGPLLAALTVSRHVVRAGEQGLPLGFRVKICAWRFGKGLV